MSYQVYDVDEMYKSLETACKGNKPFSMVSLGDAEQIFLAVPEVANINNLELYLKISGASPEMTKLKEDIIRLLPENDFVWTHTLANKENETRVAEWVDFFYKYPEIFEHYKLHINIMEQVHERYNMIVSGKLFEILKGKRLLLVGFHAPAVYELTKNKKYVEHYKKFGMDKVSFVGAVGCSEFKNGFEADDILSNIRKQDYDIALLACGITSLYLAPNIKRDGKIALDIGHNMNGLACKAEVRSYMDKYDYR